MASEQWPRKTKTTVSEGDERERWLPTSRLRFRRDVDRGSGRVRMLLEQQFASPGGDEREWRLVPQVDSEESNDAE